MKNIELNLSQSKTILEIKEDSEITGVFIGNNTSSINSQIIFNVTKPSIKSRIIIKAVTYDRSAINLDCKIVIPKGIKNVDVYLHIKVLNLSDEAKINIIPSLEIQENDVKCGHALTIGKPDQQELQYLESRGLSEELAIDLIAQGFLKMVK